MLFNVLFRVIHAIATALLHAALFCTIGPLVFAKSLFTKKISLYERVKLAFPESHQECAYDFYKRNLSNGFPVIELYRNSITNREEFYQRAAFKLHSMPKECEKGWILAESYLRFEWEIIMDRATSEIFVQNNGDLLFSLAICFSEFIENARIQTNFPDFISYPELDDSKMNLIKSIYNEKDWVTANEIYKVLSSSDDGCVCDLLNGNGAFLTKSSYYYRGCFRFLCPERVSLQYNNWWVIGQGTEDEDTGPDDGYILVDSISGNIVYCVSEEIEYLKPEPDQENNDTCFVLADDLNDFFNKLRLHDCAGGQL